ncbi:STAS domain-containing protein [Ramlibacter sp. AN1133]|uniref:STAS domain-containing protein n=1 Tax=Ramlibacter sp. AN1133 TaxID=3133429 RepID=UPI0030C20655
MNEETRFVLGLIAGREDEVLTQWVQEAGGASIRLSDGARRAMRGEAEQALGALSRCLAAGGEPGSFDSMPWAGLRDVLEALSGSRAAQGQSAGDTSFFVLALKRPLFSGIEKALGGRQEGQMAAVRSISTLVDSMAQWTVSTYQRTREDLIQRQQTDLLELSTPVIKLFEGVLAVPMIGTLDSNRTQVVMETLLQRIVDTGAKLAIIDITGVPTVDTLVAQHLLKTVSAIRLMGAECIISGIRPQIAQTIVHLGIDLHGVASKGTLADALQLALDQLGYTVTRRAA